MEKSKVAFICVHNSCRSQIAEALGKLLAGNVFYSYSAGTQAKEEINQDAVRLMKKIYKIDMEESQNSKTIDKLPEIDIVITMGCEVYCPFLEARYKEDWNLEDPTGQDDEFFEDIIYKIENNIKKLKKDILNKKILIDWYINIDFIVEEGFIPSFFVVFFTRRDY